MKQVQPKKKLGQHFLTDMSIAQRIADTVDVEPSLPVLEIGPGMGALTQFLIPKQRELKVVEIDRESIPYLHNAFPSLGQQIVEGDFLQMDLKELFGGRPFVPPRSHPVLYGDDTKGSGRTTHIGTGHQGLRHSERIAPGLVRHGIPVYRIRNRLQPATQGKKCRH